MYSITHTPTDFEIVVKSGRKWVSHVFTDEKQFQTWRKQNQDVKVKPRGKKTRVVSAVDHRGEFIF